MSNSEIKIHNKQNFYDEAKSLFGLGKTTLKDGIFDILKSYLRNADDTEISDKEFNDRFKDQITYIKTGNKSVVNSYESAIAILTDLNEQATIKKIDELLNRGTERKAPNTGNHSRALVNMPSVSKNSNETGKETRFVDAVRMCAESHYDMLNKEVADNFDALMIHIAKDLYMNPGLFSGVRYQNAKFDNSTMQRDLSNFKTTIDPDIILSAMKAFRPGRLAANVEQEKDLKILKTALPISDTMKTKFSSVGGMLAYSFLRQRKEQSNSLTNTERKKLLGVMEENRMINSQDAELLSNMDQLSQSVPNFNKYNNRFGGNNSYRR